MLLQSLRNSLKAVKALILFPKLLRNKPKLRSTSFSNSLISKPRVRSLLVLIRLLLVIKILHKQPPLLLRLNLKRSLQRRKLLFMSRRLIHKQLSQSNLLSLLLKKRNNLLKLKFKRNPRQNMLKKSRQNNQLFKKKNLKSEIFQKSNNKSLKLSRLKRNLRWQMPLSQSNKLNKLQSSKSLKEPMLKRLRRR